MEMNATPIVGDSTPPFTTNGILYSDSYCDVDDARKELSAIGYPLTAFDFEQMELITEEEYRRLPLSHGILEDLPPDFED